ncbi:unnamed protein product, partial [Mesorhabditis belari]|uniref:Uncharacterized protein n=1 Tax=Mesorhabditis belari TaxID=2138241 RepID=A0AAF3FC89_9BILA
MAADGGVLLDGRPFWLEQSDDDLPTDDDLPMNAEVVLEVWAGKIKLVPMPTIPIKLDPMAAQSQLSDKDPLFFNKQVLFGNTVRTMINATDNCNTTSSDDRSELSACNQISDIQASIDANREKQLTFVEPKDIVRYTAKKLRRDMFHKSTISDRTMKGRKK